MAIENIRLSEEAKSRLTRIKTRTGVTQWNVLCRWAFCLSLAEESVPAPANIPSDSNVEMKWKVFGGEHHELYLALLEQRCKKDGFEISNEVINEQFKLHLHRGINYLFSNKDASSIKDMLMITLNMND
ncbi:DNA sulfur modification protein DndE [Desulfatibacillum aliphaticivorans]|uniref:DNA sulfur modification protein DndE n=1 Tax=Desulfatibacillum aliphaticivorans TaxID=218208 RepID=B8FD42_DESAL|nr:DNA sulfur modification protein DndE [Desulfatibacillum aliphaticivorans]ACL06473.1 DNA sulfur modification protein DndE [Desulfatibacillum aliphaticivorans]